jgi:hypothetical protein
MSSTTRRMEVAVTLCTVPPAVSAALPTHWAGSLTGFTCGAHELRGCDGLRVCSLAASSAGLAGLQPQE